MKNITIEELSSIFNPQNQLCASNQIINNIIKKARKYENIFIINIYDRTIHHYIKFRLSS